MLIKNLFVLLDNAQKMKLFIKDFFSICDQIRSFLRIWLHLLKKSLMKTSFCAAWNEEFFFLSNTKYKDHHCCQALTNKVVTSRYQILNVSEMFNSWLLIFAKSVKCAIDSCNDFQYFRSSLGAFSFYLFS